MDYQDYRSVFLRTRDLPFLILTSPRPVERIRKDCLPGPKFCILLQRWEGSFLYPYGDDIVLRNRDWQRGLILYHCRHVRPVYGSFRRSRHRDQPTRRVGVSGAVFYFVRS